MFNNGYALIIGVDQNLDPELALDTVAKDVSAVHETLIHPERSAYNPDNVRLLKGSDSTRINIIENLGWLLQKAKADPDATVILYYSGHGWVNKATNQYFLIPYDIKDRTRLSLYALAAQDFTDLIAEINAKRMLAILDCCHAAGMDVKSIDSTGIGERKAIPAAFPVDLPQTKAIPEYKGAPGAKAVSDLLEGEGRAVLNSSTGSEYSWTRPDGRMSLFTYHLIEALTGHSPHDDDDTVVYVTDVMSWVTRQVKKSAASLGVTQTPVMRTSGVFPIAQLIGGKGVATSKGIQPPDPLEHLSSSGPAAVFNQQGQTVSGKQYNVGSIQGESVHLGDQINTSGGDYVGGDKIMGDKVGGDKIEGDKFEGINISGIQGSSIAFGRGSQATVTTSHTYGQGGDNLAALFAPLQQLVASQNPALSSKVNALKEEVGRGSNANDGTIAGLIQDLADALPATKPVLASIFNNPAISNTVGTTTKFIIGRFR